MRHEPISTTLKFLELLHNRLKEIQIKCDH